MARLQNRRSARDADSAHSRSKPPLQQAKSVIKILASAAETRRGVLATGLSITARGGRVRRVGYRLLGHAVGETEWFIHEGSPQTLKVNTVRFTSPSGSAEGAVKPGLCWTERGPVAAGKQLQPARDAHTAASKAGQSLALMRLENPGRQFAGAAGGALGTTKNPASRLGL